VDPCQPSCINGGTCIEGTGVATCQCTEHFTGQTCEEKVVGRYIMTGFTKINYHLFDSGFKAILKGLSCG